MNIFKAIENNDLAAVKELIKNISNIHRINRDFFSPLNIAVQVDNIEIIKLLLENGAKLEGKYASALDTAVYVGSDEVIELLIKQASSDLINQALCYAAKLSDPKRLKFLLDHNADINYFRCEGQNKRTPLISAVYGKKIKNIKFLLENKADINLINEEGQTALDVAVENNFLECVEFINAHYPNLKKFGIFDYISMNDLKNVEKLINENSELINAINADKNTPLIMSLKKRFYDIAKWLINNGADLNFVNKYRTNALKESIKYLYQEKNLQSVEIFKLLLKKGANFDLNNINLIYTAFERRNVPILKILIEKGVDITQEGEEKLSSICKNGLLYIDENVEIIELLLQYGIKVNIKNADGKTPYQLLKRRKPKGGKSRVSPEQCLINWNKLIAILEKYDAKNK